METARLVMLIGAPRSGTTWLQRLLSSHHGIASPQETDLFTRYITPLHAAWAWQLRGTPDDWHERRYKGLPSVVTTSQFELLVRAFIDGAFAQVVAANPGTEVIVEKSPAHSLATDVISRYIPEAPVIHIVRDGRDVAASLVAASKGWGRTWAPATVGAAAAMWAQHVNGAREASNHPGGYYEVRYEDLRRDGANTLCKVFAAIGIEQTFEECERILASQTYTTNELRPRSDSIALSGEFADFNDAAEPEGFFGRSTSGSWRDWSPRDHMAFDDAAGDLLVHLGYEADRSSVPRRPVTLAQTRVERFTVRLLRLAAARAQRGAHRLEQRAPRAK